MSSAVEVWDRRTRVKGEVAEGPLIPKSVGLAARQKAWGLSSLLQVENWLF